MIVSLRSTGLCQVQSAPAHIACTPDRPPTVARDDAAGREQEAGQRDDAAVAASSPRSPDRTTAGCRRRCRARSGGSRRAWPRSSTARRVSPILTPMRLRRSSRPCCGDLGKACVLGRLVVDMESPRVESSGRIWRGMASAAASRSRSTLRWTLPAGVLGSSVHERDVPRIFVLRSGASRVKSCSSSTKVVARRAVATTKALTTWPRSASGTPMTAASRTSGCLSIAFSISTALIVQPAEMITSSARPP